MSSYWCILRPTGMFMDRMIAPINVHSISWKMFTKHDSRNFFPWHHGIMTPSKTYSAGAGRDVASMVDNEHLKFTATLPLYITSESAVSWTNFSALLLPYFNEITVFGFHVVVLWRLVTFTNVGLILTKLRWFQFFSTSQNHYKIQVKIQFRSFLKENLNFWVSICCSTREDLSIDV